MIRWAAENDRDSILGLMKATGEYAREYDYSNYAGTVLVYQREQHLVGFVSFTLGRPETWIRQVVVDPAYQRKSLIAQRLMVAVMRLAIQYGSQGLEGFQLATRSYVTDMTKRLGASIQPGVRVRWPLQAPATEKATKWKEELLRH